jgi:predicted nucleotidyltransferase
MNPDLKQIIIATLKDLDPEMIGIFGSFTRNENSGKSDLDILVRFRSAITLLQLVHAEYLLLKRTGIKVDLVTEGTLKNKRLKDNRFRDLQIIY